MNTPLRGVHESGPSFFMKPTVGGGDESLARPPPREVRKMPASGPAFCLSVDRLPALRRDEVAPKGDFSLQPWLSWSGGPVALAGTDALPPGEHSGVQVPWRRLARGTGLGSSSACLALKLRMRSRLYAATVKPRRTVIFVRPNTRKNPRNKSANTAGSVSRPPAGWSTVLETAGSDRYVENLVRWSRTRLRHVDTGDFENLLALPLVERIGRCRDLGE